MTKIRLISSVLWEIKSVYLDEQFWAALIMEYGTINKK